MGKEELREKRERGLVTFREDVFCVMAQIGDDPNNYC